MKRSAAWKRYLITLFIGLFVSLLMLLFRGSFVKVDLLERYKDFSDAFFVSGFLLASIGGLAFVAENGVFDMIKFGVMKAISMILSEKHRAESPRTYYDYLEGKSAKSRAGYGFLIITGAAFLTLSVFFAFM
jgi:hypothetical protein